MKKPEGGGVVSRASISYITRSERYKSRSAWHINIYIFYIFITEEWKVSNV